MLSYLLTFHRHDVSNCFCLPCFRFKGGKKKSGYDNSIQRVAFSEQLKVSLTKWS